MVGPEGLKLIEVPRFQPGERLKLSQGREGVVLEDSGDDTVKLHEVTMRDLRGEGTFAKAHRGNWKSEHLCQAGH